jgi:hypothetical protein
MIRKKTRERGSIIMVWERDSIPHTILLHRGPLWRTVATTAVAIVVGIVAIVVATAAKATATEQQGAD